MKAVTVTTPTKDDDLEFSYNFYVVYGNTLPKFLKHTNAHKGSDFL